MVGKTSEGILRRDFLGVSAATVGTAAAFSNEASAQSEVTIEMMDGLVFDPDETTIEPGTTVSWENVGSVGHSVTAYEDEIPDDAEYFASGGFDSEDTARQAYPDGDIPGGETYEHTFEVEGTYGYFCIPHEQAGMVAELTVSANTGGDGEGDGGVVPSIPESARVLSIVVISAMVLVITLAYFFLKYSGDYGLE